MKNVIVSFVFVWASFLNTPRETRAAMVAPPVAQHPNPAVGVLKAMEVLARSEGTTTSKLMKDPEAVARTIVEQAEAKRIDPLLLVTIAWTESRFRAEATGDPRAGHPRSCGMTQVRVDIAGRPSCDELLDPEVALGWTAGHLAATSEKGRLRLDRYNGGDYEVRIWRKVDWLRRELNHVVTPV